MHARLPGNCDLVLKCSIPDTDNVSCCHRQHEVENSTIYIKLSDSAAGLSSTDHEGMEFKQPVFGRPIASHAHTAQNISMNLG